MYKIQKETKFVDKFSSPFNEYAIINQIGKGCRSNLFKVQEISSHDIYAMKIIPKKDNDEMMQQVMNKINLLSSLNHPNIIKIYDSFDMKNNQNEEFLVVITDYCENGSLIDYSTTYGFQNDTEKKFIAFHLLEAIRYLHKHGIAHRNIRPENILLDKSLTPKLCNFSNFTKFNDKNFFKEDIWSFGITLYEAFELSYPFKKVEDVINDRVTIVKSIRDKNLKKLIFECIKRKAEYRPTADNLAKEEYFLFMNKHSEKKNKKRNNSNQKKKFSIERDFYFSLKNIL